MALVAILATLSIEVEGRAIDLECGWDTSLYGVTGRFDGWLPPRQLITLGFSFGVEAVVGGGEVYHVFFLRIRMPQVP